MDGDVFYEIEGLELVERELDALHRAVGPGGLRPLLKTIGIMGERRAADAFRNEAAPDMVADVGDATNQAGQAWEPLSENTEAARRADGSQAKALQDTGLGKASVTSEVGDGYVEIGAGVEYMVFQHGGTDPYIITPKDADKLVFVTAGGLVITDEVHHPGLPARPFIGFDNEDVRHMLDLMMTHLDRAGV